MEVFNRFTPAPTLFFSFCVLPQTAYLKISLSRTVSLSRWVYSYGDSSLLKIIPVNRFILWRIRSAVRKQAYCQGYGRHTPEEVKSLCKQDLQALSDQIGKFISFCFIILLILLGIGTFLNKLAFSFIL